ncbi:hypothetical protein KCP74_02765 [Salmonella enterica subsp. enterica]|nr:hypothetical protein KCP74_02765 [Salmonella enterica subsp. enterica]
MRESDAAAPRGDHPLRRAGLKQLLCLPVAVPTKLAFRTAYVRRKAYAFWPGSGEFVAGLQPAISSAA